MESADGVDGTDIATGCLGDIGPDGGLENCWDLLGLNEELFDAPKLSLDGSFADAGPEGSGEFEL